MIIQKDYKISYYSKITFPPGKGLFSQIITLDYETTGKHPKFIIKISPAYHEKSIESGADHIVVQSQSVFELQTDGEISINELYDLSKESINYLRTFVKNQTKKPSPIRPFPDPPLGEILHSLTAVVEHLDNNR